MAYPIQVTLSTGNKVSLNYQSQEVSVTLTYQLEREDTDVLALVQEKTRELAQAHQLAWQGLHEAKTGTMQSVEAENVAPASTLVPSEEKRDTKTDSQWDVEADSQTANSTDLTHSVDLAASHLPPDEWTKPKAPLEPATQGQRGALRVMLQQARWTDEDITDHLHTQFGCERIEDLNAAQAAEWLLELQRTARLQVEQQRLQDTNHSRNGAKT
jgi:hypothetical protein